MTNCFVKKINYQLKKQDWYKLKVLNQFEIDDNFNHSERVQSLLTCIKNT